MKTKEELAKEFAEDHSIVPEFLALDTTNNSILCAALFDQQLLAAAFLAGYEAANTHELKGVLGAETRGMHWMLKTLSKHVEISPEILDIVTTHYQDYIRNNKDS